MKSSLHDTVRPHTGQTFLHGALILTAGILLVKVIGALFKIPLTWIIGEDGLGYFNTAYHFYNPIHSLATAGFPIAISRLVSEQLARGQLGNARKFHRVSIPIFIIAGLLGTSLMVCGAPFYVSAIHNTESLPSMLVLSPAILFGCLMSIYRGYFEGLHNMVPTAISEILEALSKLLLGLSGALAIVWIGMEQYHQTGSVFGQPVVSEAYARSVVLPYAAAAAVFGVTIGSLAGFFYLFLKSRRSGQTISQSDAQLSPATISTSSASKLLMRTALPIGLGALAVNVAGLVDTTLLQTRIAHLMETDSDSLLSLYAGAIPEFNISGGTVPNFLYGCYSQALTLFMVVPSITQAIGVSALPSVTAAWTTGSRKTLESSVASVLRITGLFCIPTSLCLSTLAYPITSLLFGGRMSSPITSRVLIVLGIAALFAALSTPINSMLQAVDRADLPVKLLLVGLSLKVVLTWVLVGIPQINIVGAALATLCCYAFLTVTGLVCLHRVTGVCLMVWSSLGKPLFGAILSAAGAYVGRDFLSKIVPQTGATALSLGIAVGIYLFSLWLLCAIHKSDILLLPNGEKIAKRLEKFRFFV